MATGAGRGHTPAAPTGGTGTPTETPPPPPGHRHPHGDTGILSWIRAPGPYRRRRDPRGSSAHSGEHGGPTVAQTHGHPHTGQLRAPRAKFGVSRSPPLPGLKPPQSCSVAAAGAGGARFGTTRGTGWVRGAARGCEHGSAAGETRGGPVTMRGSRSLPRRVSGPGCN